MILNIIWDILQKHLAAIKRFGIRDIHRKTYKPIKDIIDKQIFKEEQNV